jgi:predicted transcriptional regulator
MAPIRRRLFERFVALSESRNEPVTAAELAAELGVDPAVVQAHLQSLRQCELVKHAAETAGYVPTVTAHELLALDLDDEGLLVVDVVDE